MTVISCSSSESSAIEKRTYNQEQVVTGRLSAPLSNHCYHVREKIYAPIRVIGLMHTAKVAPTGDITTRELNTREAEWK